jgi:hypothetical protein
VDSSAATRADPATMDVMGFDDLPDDWDDRPLTDPRLVADVLDLLVPDKDRCAGALVLLVCDRNARLVQPVAVTDVDEVASEGERQRAVEVIIGMMDGPGSLHIALARRDGLSLTEADRAWRRAAQRACGAGVRLLGVHGVTVAGSREGPAVPLADAS